MDIFPVPCEYWASGSFQVSRNVENGEADTCALMSLKSLNTVWADTTAGTQANARRGSKRMDFMFRCVRL
jgi:hypothetical protein